MQTQCTSPPPPSISSLLLSSFPLFLPNTFRLPNFPQKIMKQKIVIKLGCMNNRKLRSKALKISVSCSGVEGARFKGEAKEQIEVIGEGLDIVGLTNMLRKCVGHAELLSVSPMKEEENRTKDTKSNSQLDHKMVCYYPESVPYYPIHHSRTSYQYQDPYYCSIM